jgi:DNA-binding MurR/RpiR family transcriptional regulator
MAQALGFEGYEAFRAPFRHALVSVAGSADHPEWIDRLRASGPSGRVQAEASLNSLAVVERSLERLNPEALNRAVDLMQGARAVYVTAVRASHAMAHYFHYAGRMALPTLQLIPRHMGSAIDDLNAAQAGDVMLAIAVTPYSRETIETCGFAQERGIKLILLTDSDIVAPDLRPDAVLLVSVLSTHHFGCFSGIAAALEVLLALLVDRGGPEAQARIRSCEDLRKGHNAYWVGDK